MADLADPRSPAYRVAVVGMGTECSTFTPQVAHDDDFRVTRGAELAERYPFLEEWRLPEHPRVEFVPLFQARAMPGGPIAPETFERLAGELIERLAAAHAEARVDAVYLDLHGAMNVRGRLDAEAELARRVRAVVDDEREDPVLLGASMDLHGQVSRELAELVDVPSCYRSAPHVDYLETRRRVMGDLAGYLEGGVRPVRAWVRVPVLLPGEMTSTRLEPARSIYATLDDGQHPDGVTDASLWVGYAWADEPRSAAAVVTHGTEEDAVVAEAQRVAQAWFDARDAFVFCAPAAQPDEAIERALTSSKRPFFVSDSGDNPTAGGSNDVAWFLGRLLAHPRLVSGAQTAIWASCVDEAAVGACAAAGVGASVDLTVGGQFGGSDPVRLVGEVVSLTPNEHSGPIAVVRSGGVHAVLTTRREAFHFVRQLHDLGLDPAAVDVTVIKIGYLEPDLYDAAADHLLALTPGGVDQDLLRLEYRQVVRPIHPLDGFDADSLPDLTPLLLRS